MITFGHSVNGDFQREKYQTPQQLDATNTQSRNVINYLMYPWSYALVIHALYEWTLALNMTAAVFFWGVEILLWARRDTGSFEKTSYF